jgi:hypothetical protein
MAPLIDVVGNMTTSLGKFEVKTPQTKFLSWVSKGLALDPVDEQFIGLNDDDEPDETWIWPNHEGTLLTHEAANRTTLRLRNESHQLTVETDSGPIRITGSLPEFEETRWNDTQLFPHEQRDNWRLAHFASLVTTAHLVSNSVPPGTPEGVTLDQLLSAVGLRRHHPAFSIANIRNGYLSWQAHYRRDIQPHLSAYFVLAESPHGERGYGAQLVSSAEMYAESQFPLSDADLAVGHMISPARSVSFAPLQRAYSKRERGHALASTAAKSIKITEH